MDPLAHAPLTHDLKAAMDLLRASGFASANPVVLWGPGPGSNLRSLHSGDRALTLVLGPTHPWSSLEPGSADARALEELVGDQLAHIPGGAGCVLGLAAGHRVVRLSWSAADASGHAFAVGLVACALAAERAGPAPPPAVRCAASLSQALSRRR